MAAIIVIVLLFVLAFLRVPIAISLVVSSVTGLFLVDFSLNTVIQKMFTGVNSTTLMAIPGFVFAGLIMAKGGISKYLIECIKTWVGHTKGGLSVVAVLTCMVFAAISGSSPATAAAIGAIMIPMMVKAGYDKNYAMGLVAAAGTLGILIPPSIPLILYSSVSEESTGKLFSAGILPGILLGLALMVYAVIVAHRKGYGGLEKVPLNKRWRPTLKAIWGLVMPVLILGAIYSGIVTPTEASFLACLYAIIVSIFIYRELDWAKFKQILTESVTTTSMIFLIIAAALILGMFLTTEQIPQEFATWVSDSGFNKWTFLIIISIVFFILGMFLEPTAIILITLPILLPIIAALDINVIHFAIIMVVNMELGMITPPVGLNLFVVSAIAEEKVDRVIKGVIPFFAIFAIVLVLIIIFPEISLLLAK
ncbi:TRAP transporter large permease [Psychrobacillus lasiicapitis]|uniref:TRAP transporter large permease subunit n=1 Tax=Psychrobacillus lasiicapitis TaxID=1636719 RepID=A0A544T2W8_9BACI|nr:TRAP transporter large permease subunit [Psychrobacillus lasiicapitis]TQR11799.1 TRAP transporter large permease subunit [Psychrobacillus lasiicapitis]GGA19498.1 C4-dicarboxylate ABC transporter permease [Psychrobacillus lasiicapitis]